MSLKDSETMNIDNIESQIKELLNQKRYIHSKNVSITAAKLAEIYHADPEKAAILGLVHDCAKDFTLSKQKQMLEQYKILLNKYELRMPGIWHSYIGSDMARDYFDINDEEMLEAIYYHSTAKEQLSILAKILYVADKIEPNRKMFGVNSARKEARKNINQTMLILLNREILHLVQQDKLIHPNTIKARNSILYNII